MVLVDNLPNYLFWPLLAVYIAVPGVYASLRFIATTSAQTTISASQTDEKVRLAQACTEVCHRDHFLFGPAGWRDRDLHDRT